MGVLVLKLILLIYSLVNGALFVCSMHLRMGGNQTDRLALLAIKAQIKQDPHNVTSSWNESIHFCSWHGVSCVPRHRQRVTRLDLQSQKLAGSLSPHIGNLSFLRALELQNNNFSNKIPPEIGHLSRLQVLFLHRNSFSGPIPDNISYCSNLILMNISVNRLVGKIPSEFGSLSKLQRFILSLNNLTGEIPPSLGNLSSLEGLDVAQNNLVGTIPTSLGQLKNLTHLFFGSNYLSGTIPPSIYNLSALYVFKVEVNQIQGRIPLDLGKTLPNLQIFSIAMNQFFGSIPLSLSNATSLRTLCIANNNLTGQMPDFRKLHNLVYFLIQYNHLGSGTEGDLTFLTDLTNSTELKWLSMNENHFGGTLPTSISNLSTKLEKFWFHRNQIHGSIPTDIGNLVNLESLEMGENSLTGNIPTEIQKLSSLAELYISMSALSGSIPSSLGNLTKLYRLSLNGNNLEGVIPSSLGNCQRLIYLDLSNNKLSGAIPQQVISLPSLSIYLNLSTNHFTGSLPTEVGKLKSLGVLDVSNNMLSGELPSSLGSCESLEVLHLQGNFFKGPIPSSMIGLRGIEELDLSRNNLSGEIPKFLGDFVFLKKLDLSFNEFWGAVPTGGGAFKNASAISITGNTKLCGGIADLQLPKCKSQKGGSSHGSKLIIPLVLSGLALLLIVMVMSYFFLCSSRRKRKEIPLSTLANNFSQVSYATLLRATDEFSSANLIGAGSFGSVYKGILDDNDKHQLVAVKVFNLLRHGASRSFMAECEALRNIKHRNLVEIITACSSVDFHGNDFKALVYKYMDRGSLEEWLHPPTEIEEVREALNLEQRLEIAIDVACALDYLHNHCETPIVHCDLKPSNVLLDNEITGHVSDFGLARFLSQEAGINVSNNHTSSIGIKGTVGYAAPEYGMGSDVSTNGDVYSFGILLLEMFAGKRPTDYMFNGDLNLHAYVKMAFPNRVMEIVDSTLFEGGTNEKRVQKIEVCLNSILRIGIECSAESPTDRLKNISDAAFELHSIRDVLLG
ncbi:PREDICTED: probable LRR receptor-like serine/threonine-protein kinase At3g47570 [Prunus mume]|uniref:Probable LRR receptor-like serine/threonine-protein kinase At3g47570 n=1 Tax=Prunus mume TaxID=102107 RepID=A0ABM0NGE8_PRUMU|nr:PREDICTED: probable LRR receptor-like serine/threonine-protein kinase At3g47570 [Prunus mume]